MTRKWKIFYSDESTFSSEEGSPLEAPSFGILVIVQSDSGEVDSVGREVLNRWDWYFYEPTRGEWWGCDLQGLLDRLLHNLPTVAVKQGRSVHNSLYKKVVNKATKDPDFPIRSGSKFTERP